MCNGRVKGTLGFASQSTSVPHVSVLCTILTSNKLTKIDFSNVFPGSNVVTKFQFVDHVIDLGKKNKKNNSEKSPEMNCNRRQNC